MLSMLGGAWAWACTVYPTIMVDPVGDASPDGAVGAPGSALVVRGNAVAANSPVTVRWNAMDGPVLGVATSAASGAYKLDATVPASAPGIYFLVAEVNGVGVARTSFEVRGPAGVEVSRLAPSQLWPAKPTAGAGSATAVGLGLLGAGLVSLFCGVALVTVGRRRQPVTVR